ncbi:MAG: phage integrase SAM-like domain-containing protein [Acidobacteria bacterium]|nr:phage integrase SAM-like domain-containing protein [Acidobacteriota bacterium]
MALYKRANTKNYWTKFYFDGKLIQQSTKCSNLKAAGEFEASLRHQLNFRRIDLDAPKEVEEPKFPVFSEVVAEFLASPNSKRKESTRRRYETASWALIEHFGPMRIDKITREDVERFIAWRTAQKKKAPALKLKKNSKAKTTASIKPATINRELGLLRAIFNRKIEVDQMVLVNPTKKLFP